MITTTMAIEILIEALAVSEALTKKTEKTLSDIPYKTTSANISRRNKYYDILTYEEARQIQITEAIRILK